MNDLLVADDDSAPEVEVEVSPPARIDIGRAQLRQIERYITEQKLQPRQMEKHFGGRVLADSRGNKYVRHNGGLRLVMLVEDGKARPIKKWGKARKKAEKRKRRNNGNRTA